MTLTAYDVEELHNLILQFDEAIYLFRESEELPPVLLNEIFLESPAGLPALHEKLQAAPDALMRQLVFQRALLDALDLRLRVLPCLKNIRDGAPDHPGIYEAVHFVDLTPGAKI